MFRVYWTNHGYYSQDEFTQLADAVAHVKKVFFDAQIYHAGELCATWTIFGGLRMYE